MSEPRPFALVLVLALVVWVGVGCDDDTVGEPGPTEPTPIGGGTVTQFQAGVTIAGRVCDRDNTALEGVRVVMATQTTATNEEGEFLLADLPPGRQVVGFQSSWRQSLVRVIDLEAGMGVFWSGSPWNERDDGVTLESGTQALLDSTGAALNASTGSLRIEVPDSAAVGLDGQPHLELYIATCYGLPRRESGFLSSWPGSMRGIRHDGGEELLLPHAFLETRFFANNGDTLALAAGRLIEARYGVPANELPQISATMPVWRLDPATGVWHESAQALLDGSDLRFALDHLGVWALAEPVDEVCTITGQVIDRQDQPVSGAQVLGRLDDPIWGDATVTDAEGWFSMTVPARGLATLVASIGRMNRSSTTVDVAGLQQVSLDDPIQVRGMVGTVDLTWGDEPRDLDLRLCVPDGEDPEGAEVHVLVYFGDDGSLTGMPYAELSADDTDAHGPETITLSRLVEGRYQVWVHHWDGEEPAVAKAGDPVQVRLVLAGQTWLFEREQAPDAGQCWHVCDLESTGETATVVPVLAMGSPPAGLLNAKSRGAEPAPGL